MANQTLSKHCFTNKSTRVAQTYTRVLRINDYDFATVYRKNEHVIVSDYDQPQEWVMQVTAILVYGPICNKIITSWMETIMLRKPAVEYLWLTSGQSNHWW